jgi:O-antigen/teichoic acid export membrane protein
MLQRSYDQAFWIGAAITAVIVALGPWAIGVLYGSAYDSAGEVLRIHVLALPFVFMGAVFSKWILAEDLLVASLVRHAAGAALNVALNLVLIPEWGLKGAAVATVVSYVTASYLACFIGGSTRQAGIQMSLAIFAPLRLAVSATRRVRRT